MVDILIFFLNLFSFYLAQVTFVSSEPLPPEFTYVLQFGKVTYNLYSHSFLHFGQVNKLSPKFFIVKRLSMMFFLSLLYLCILYFLFNILRYSSKLKGQLY